MDYLRASRKSVQKILNELYMSILSQMAAKANPLAPVILSVAKYL